MTIFIDSIRLDDNCFQTPEAPQASSRHHARPAAPQAQCTGTFSFHVVDSGNLRSIPQSIPFERIGAAVRIPQNLHDVVAMQVSAYDLNTYVSQPSTQTVFAFATVLEGMTRNYIRDAVLNAEREPGLDPQRNSAQAIQALREQLTRNAQAGGLAFFNFILFGNMNGPDSVQRQAFQAMAENVYDSGGVSRSSVASTMSAFVTCNNASFGSSPAFVSRANTTLDVFFLARAIRQSIPALVSDALKARLRQFFFQCVHHLYFNAPSLNELLGDLRVLALDLYRLPPQGTPPGRINLYVILSRVLSGEPVNTNVCDSRDNNNFVALGTRAPFNAPRGEHAARLTDLVRLFGSLQGSLNENTLRYLSLPPVQATFESIYDPLATPQGRQALVARITTDTRIVRPAHLTSQWLSDNNNLREALEACLFDPAHPERGALTLVRGRNGAQEFQLNVNRLIENVNTLYTFQLNVPRLRSNVNTLLGANLTNRREFQATVLSLMFGLFGDRGQNASLRAFVDGSFQSVPLRINEADRGDLERFYAETIRDLGVRDALTEVLAPTLQGVACAAGVATSVGLLASGEQNSGQFSPGLAAGGFLTGAGCAPLTARLFTGTPRNAWRQWGTVGGPAAVGLGVLMGFLPLIVSAANGDGNGGVMMMMPPMPMGRPITGRNPVTGYGQ